MLQVRRADVKVGKPAETEAAMGLIKGLLSSPPLLLQVALFLSLLKKNDATAVAVISGHK